MHKHLNAPTHEVCREIIIIVLNFTDITKRAWWIQKELQ